MPARLCTALLALALCAGLLSACAPKRYVLPPTQIRVELKGATTPTPTPALDLSGPPEALFTRGHTAYQRGLNDDALAYFKAIVERYPQSRAFIEAAYNAGLLCERKKDYAQAVTFFEALVAAPATAKDKTDARFRLLACYDKLKNHDAVLKCAAELLTASPPLPTEDRVEAMARRGQALFNLERTAEAQRELEAAVQLYHAGLRHEEIADEAAGAMALHYLGRLKGREFAAVVLTLDTPEAMAARMEQKARLLLDAQEFYLQCIKQDNALWATASGLEIGRLYRDFYAAIRAVPTPPELAPESEEARMYHCVLAKNSLALLRKAMRILDRTQAMAQRLHVHNDAVNETEATLEAIKTQYANETEACASVLPAESAESAAAAKAAGGSHSAK